MKRPFSGTYPLTQGFGGNPESYKRFGLLGHNGLDYGLPTGTEVLAPHSGKVIEAASDPTGYGNYLKIENDKEGSVLAHLQNFLVKVGDNVTEGQAVAHSDNTGNSTGPHLHWGYYIFPRNRANGYAGFIDQMPLLLIKQSQPQQDTQSIIDELRLARDTNWNLYQAELAKNTELTGGVNTQDEEIAQYKTDALAKDAEIASLLANYKGRVEEDQKAVDDGIHASLQLKEELQDKEAVAHALNAKATLKAMLTAVDDLRNQVKATKLEKQNQVKLFLNYLQLFIDKFVKKR